MSNAVQAQHPAVVLRSSYQHLRALLAIAAIVIVGLTVTVVVLALNSGATTTASPAARANPSAIRAHSSAETGTQAPATGALCGDACSGHGYGSVGVTTSDYTGH